MGRPDPREERQRVTDLLGSEQRPETLEIPDESLWLIRLRLAWTTFKKNWVLFRRM